GDAVLLDAFLGGVDDAAAGGEREPISLGIAVLRRAVLLDLRILDRLRDPQLFRIDKAPDVDRQDDVSRRIRAFGRNAVLKALVDEKGLCLDAGFLLESIEERLDEIGLAIGVDVNATIGLSGAGNGCTA